jgi:hypothetical protein
MVGDSVAMALVAANTVAITIIAVTTIMPTVANSAAAMNEITSRSASSIMSSNVGSIKAISLNSAAWTTFRAGTFFSANLKVIIANLIKSFKLCRR